ncbi:MAG: hypothetical protein LBF85_08020 [Tannerella sp.]|jgi:hypothetical protein|nr:hypothetical protein [Tannerella sp.]
MSGLLPASYLAVAMTADAIADSNGIPVIARSVATWQSRHVISRPIHII